MTYSHTLKGRVSSVGEQNRKVYLLIACEESQEVTMRFRKLGFIAFSCDILPCSGGHQEWHIQDDVRNWLGKNEYNDFQGWDGIIAFPPCTDLCVSGAKYFERKRKDGSQQKSIEFFMIFANADCERVVIENPVGIMSSKWRKPDQIIQPYMFGDEAKKTTCLWIKGFPLLKPTKLVSEGEFYISPNGDKMPKWSHDPVGKDGKKIAYNSQEIKILRSKTFPGIAEAMASQWGAYLTKLNSEGKFFSSQP
jgi:site-specific DNA-cytosine methylase